MHPMSERSEKFQYLSSLCPRRCEFATYLRKMLKLYCAVQVLLMSDELRLDEVYCLLCLLTSHEEVLSRSAHI